MIANPRALTGTKLLLCDASGLLVVAYRVTTALYVDCSQAVSPMFGCRG